MVRPHLVNGTTEAQAAAQGYTGPGESNSASVSPSSELLWAEIKPHHLTEGWGDPPAHTRSFPSAKGARNIPMQRFP